MDLKAYDALITTIYDAGTGELSIEEMFERMRNALGGDLAGVSVYDDADRWITHTLFSACRVLPRGFLEKSLPFNEQPGVKLVSGARLPMARRFTDIVPEGRLRNMEWYRRQADIAGLGHGVLVDVGIARVRVRLFAVRAHGAANFSQDEVDVISRLSGHLRRSFTSTLRLLSPRHVSGNLQLIIFSEDNLASVFHDDPFDRQLALRYGLSPAERRVLKVMATGPTRKKAAEQLDIGINSLKTHMRFIYAKMGLKRLPDLLLMVQRMEGSLNAAASTDCFDPGSGFVGHSQKMKVAARAAEKKTAGQRS